MRLKSVRLLKRMGALLLATSLVVVIGLTAASADNGPDRVVGTRYDDVLAGGKGPDIIIAKAGDDRLWGGRGPDTFKCGPGFDVAHNIRDTSNDTFSNCEVVKTA